MESDLQRAVYSLLEQHGIRYARNNSGARGHVRFGLTIPGVRGGAPDLLVFPGGLRIFRARSVFDAYRSVQEAREESLSVYGLELKATHGDKCKPSCKSCAAQKEWAERMKP